MSEFTSRTLSHATPTGRPTVTGPRHQLRLGKAELGIRVRQSLNGSIRVTLSLRRSSVGVADETLIDVGPNSRRARRP
jgi:hypothetical protein